MEQHKPESETTFVELAALGCVGRARDHYGPTHYRAERTMAIETNFGYLLQLTKNVLCCASVDHGNHWLLPIVALKQLYKASSVVSVYPPVVQDCGD